MTFQRMLACLLIAIVAVPSALAKQRPDSPQIWRAFAERLEAGALVKVTLKDRTKVKGHFVTIEGDAILVKPKTRVPVAIRDVRFSDIDSIDRQREGWPPGAKVLTGLAVGVGAVLLIGLSIALSWD